MDIYQIAAILAGFILTAGGLPQLFKILKLKEVKDLSLPMFLLFFIGQSIWLIYGLHLNDFPIIVSNAAAMTVNFIIIWLIIRYRHGKNSNQI